MKTTVTILAALAAACGGRADEAGWEKRVLFGRDSAPGWSAPESRMEASSRRVEGGQASLHWHVTVDYETGEPNYPIGWPRVNHRIAEAERDWSDWEYPRLRIYAETSREELPREPVGLAVHSPDKASAFSRTLAELRKGEWVEILVPLAQLPCASDVRLVQFHIAEANYRHGDRLDLFIDELALVRHAKPVLAEFAAVGAVVFSDARQLPVRFSVLGVKPGAEAEIVCELRGKNGPVARAAWAVSRGAHRRVLDWGRDELAEGEYELAARMAGDPVAATAALRVVESPWRQVASQP